MQTSMQEECAASKVKPDSQWRMTLRNVVGIPTVYRRIYRHEFLTLYNQILCYIRKCIRIRRKLSPKLSFGDVNRRFYEKYISFYASAEP